MVVFIRSFVADFDGKIQKYFSCLNKNNIPFHYIGWARGDAKKISTKKETFFQKKAPLGGGINNIFNLFLWNFFIFKQLIKKRKNIKVVHAVDFDCALISYIFCRLFKKVFVFDVYDKYTEVRKFPGILTGLINKIEFFLIKKADLCILADENRYAQHGLSKNTQNVIVLENVPSTSQILISELKEIKADIQIGYFGVLEPENRGLEDLIDAVNMNSNIVFHVVGYGGLSDFMLENSKKNKNIRFYGPKTAEEGLNIMKDMDILVGMYYKTVKNHLFAAPNKYYEHLMLGRAMLTTIGTPPGEKVILNDTGWAVEEGMESLNNWLVSLHRDNSIIRKANNASKLWQEKYANYYLNYYEGNYLMKIKNFFYGEN